MDSIKELSVVSVPDLWKRRAEIFSSDRADLKGIGVDSAGVAFLVRWAKSLGSGRKLMLEHPSADLVRLIGIFRVGSLFELKETR
ncbi:MAG: anti-anti-sigma factor [Succinivibrio sp.]|jgi:ABC-type transporter Mla MlaB component|nr:anti-anti-sigma factor [Succinivibrio sp.]